MEVHIGYSVENEPRMQVATCDLNGKDDLQDFWRGVVDQVGLTKFRT